MRRVRGEIDWYYTENLFPAEAVEKAWELREKHEELKKLEARKKLVYMSCHVVYIPYHYWFKMFGSGPGGQGNK
jgi:hypothetical protein